MINHKMLSKKTSEQTKLQKYENLKQNLSQLQSQFNRLKKEASLSHHHHRFQSSSTPSEGDLSEGWNKNAKAN
jgi:hypothetical protein